jgi:transcriptional regulator with XRE-family HTH domain
MIQTPEAVKALRLAAGLTQVELCQLLCQLTSISPIDINEAETGERLLGGTQWTLMQHICGNRIRGFKRSAGGYD